MTTPTARLPRHAFSSFSLNADQIILADGTLWSHAATLGTRFKGESFCIDQPCVENFVKVFATGYPQKIPVDYEHGSTTNDPEVRKARAQGQVPKAGDVLELRGVFSASDFTGDLKTAAEKLSAAAARPLDDARNFGLWMRWKPTARALAAVKAGEYTELSIAFDDDLPNNTTGEGQGPGLWAVALLNTPFLDDMLPVAASRDTGRSPAAPASREGEMNKLTVLSVAAAVLGKALTSEDEALQELNGLGTQLHELRGLREAREILAAEFGGEKDPVKLVAKIRELKGQVQTATDSAAAQKKAAIKTTVDAKVKEFEKQLTVPLKEMMTRNLTKELEDGVELEKTETLKALKSLQPLGIFQQNAGPDAGGAGADADSKIEARAQELLANDPKLKALAATNQYQAYKDALVRAEREIKAATSA